MFFSRMVEKFEKKRRLVEFELDEKERIEREEEEKKIETIRYLENGGVELELKKMICKFLNGEKIRNQTFRVTKEKIGIFFNFDDVAKVYPFRKNYYGGAVGIILKQVNGSIDFRVACIPISYFSESYGMSSHTTCFWEVKNKNKYDMYTTIPNLFDQKELNSIWNGISNTLPPYDDF